MAQLVTRVQKKLETKAKVVLDCLREADRVQHRGNFFSLSFLLPDRHQCLPVTEVSQKEIGLKNMIYRISIPASQSKVCKNNLDAQI